MGRRKRGGREHRRKIEKKELNEMKRLATWIHSVRRKKHESEKKEKLRIAVVLTQTLRYAECEYRATQISRVNRQLRQPLKGVENVGIVHNCGSYNAAERDIEYQHLISKKNNLWQESLCQDLSSLDNFLQQLGQVKSVVQR